MGSRGIATTLEHKRQREAVISATKPERLIMITDVVAHSTVATDHSNHSKLLRMFATIEAKLIGLRASQAQFLRISGRHLMHQPLAGYR
jgi:hypothetical protein